MGWYNKIYRSGSVLKPRVHWICLSDIDNASLMRVTLRVARREVIKCWHCLARLFRLSFYCYHNTQKALLGPSSTKHQLQTRHWPTPARTNTVKYKAKTSRKIGVYWGRQVFFRDWVSLKTDSSHNIITELLSDGHHPLTTVWFRQLWSQPVSSIEFSSDEIDSSRYISQWWGMILIFSKLLRT